MLKFFSKISSRESANLIGEFLDDQELVQWSIEKDCPGDEYFLCGYVPDERAGNEDFAKIKSAFGDLENAKIATLNPSDWEEAYRKSAKLWKCEDLYWIPTFLKDEVEIPEGGTGIYIEPGMAFGSGSHETSQLCARALVMFKSLYKKTDDLVIKSCLDIGCGSGILGISALKLGLSHATFIDIDEDAIRISRENALANGLFLDQMDFVTGDVRVGLLGRHADLLLANILSDVLVANADLLVNSVNPGGLLCVSGILKDEKFDVASEFTKFIKKRWASVVESSMDDGEWSLLAYFRG
ncbi:MAG: 50S ribosomal protein L11 methyltransferase [Puniceicoccales bacterium]|jgi:ribosomal protein L11 methyltransferase|nr:50S ribosomal protein L11 methyltransferase [Puniceicoccales bacterium]